MESPARRRTQTESIEEEEETEPEEDEAEVKKKSSKRKKQKASKVSKTPKPEKEKPEKRKKKQSNIPQMPRKSKMKRMIAVVAVFLIFFFILKEELIIGSGYGLGYFRNPLTFSSYAISWNIDIYNYSSYGMYWLIELVKSIFLLLLVALAICGMENLLEIAGGQHHLLGEQSPKSRIKYRIMLVVIVILMYVFTPYIAWVLAYLYGTFKENISIMLLACVCDYFLLRLICRRIAKRIIKKKEQDA